MPDLSDNDSTIADLALDGATILAATSPQPARNQPAIRGSDGTAAFVGRGIFLDAEAEPVGLFPAFAATRGLVMGVL